MKKYVVLAIILSGVFAFVGCSYQNVETEADDTPPAIILLNKEYTTQPIAVTELPEGYEYMGTLSEESANNTGLTGCKTYANINLNSLKNIYVYQEYENPNSEDDLAPKQWAYVQWALSE